MQKFTSLQNHSIYDPTTAGSDGIIDELKKEVLASVSVKDIDKWIVKNDDTLGKGDTIITITGNTIVSSDTKSSASVIDYRDDIDKRIMKINNLDRSSEAVTISSSLSSSSASSMALTKGEEEAPVRKISNGIISKCKQTNNNHKNGDVEKSNKSKGQKRKINCIEISSKEDDKDDDKLDPLQLLLLKKGRKLNKILLHPSVNNDDTLNISNRSGSKIINVLNELSAEPIKIMDENSAEARIYQWQKQELQYEKFRVALESYNLKHLMSLVQI